MVGRRVLEKRINGDASFEEAIFPLLSARHESVKRAQSVSHNEFGENFSVEAVSVEAVDFVDEV